MKNFTIKFIIIFFIYIFICLIIIFNINYIKFDPYKVALKEIEIYTDDIKSYEKIKYDNRMTYVFDTDEGLILVNIKRILGVLWIRENQGIYSYQLNRAIYIDHFNYENNTIFYGLYDKDFISKIIITLEDNMEYVLDYNESKVFILMLPCRINKIEYFDKNENMEVYDYYKYK